MFQEPSRETQSPPYIPPAAADYRTVYVPPHTGNPSTTPPAGYPPQNPQTAVPDHRYGIWMQTESIRAAAPQKLKPPNWKLFGIILGCVLGGIALLFTLAYVSPSSSSDLDVDITSCEFTDGPLPTGTVGYVVTNNGDRRDSARISVEYQNFRGEKVDDDVETSQDVAPGQTVRGAVTTLLDVEVGNGGKCILTGVS